MSHRRTDLSYGPDAHQKLDVYLPASGVSDTVVVFWHGGSWQGGDKKTYAFVGRTLARMGYVAVVPNYRLYPDVVFPAFVQDGAAAVRWAFDNYQPRTIVLMGHSAGSLIAADLALDPHYLEATGTDKLPIAGMIGLSGPYDFTPWPRLKPIFQDTDPSVWKPINLAARPSPYPFLLIHGRLDYTVKPANSISLAGAVNRVGGRAKLIQYPYFDHMSMLLPLIGPFAYLFPLRRQIKRFIADL
jgi:acetyl esterase/lipase